MNVCQMKTPRLSQRKLIILLTSNLYIFTYNLSLARSLAQHQNGAPLPWPAPQEVAYSDNYFWLNRRHFSFALSLNVEKCPILVKAIDRYMRLTFPANCGKRNDTPQKWPGSGDGKIIGLNVDVKGMCESVPFLDMNESYSLTIPEALFNGYYKGLLVSATVWGALRGLETFSQLVYNEGDHYFVNGTVVRDYPRFSHRGLLIDTARHFIPLPVLLKNLDAMAYNKLNVLHWHMVDDQSFPFVSQRFPGLSQQGSYDPQTHVYSPEDVQKVISYAAERGIRVVVEFDTPGHSKSWKGAFPGLLTECDPQFKPGPNVPDNFQNTCPMDGTRNETFTFLAEFFAEVAAVFPDKYVHIGADEVWYDCCLGNERIKRFIAENNVDGDTKGLTRLFVEKVIAIVEASGKTPIVWQEAFDADFRLTQNTVVEIWKDWAPGGFQSAAQRITGAGHRMILSGSTLWYLDTNNDWKYFYSKNPQGFEGTDHQKSLVIGGEACLWTEKVDTSNFFPKIWPRTSAVAERLWSSKEVKDIEEADPRIEWMRCLMIRRGIPVQPNGQGFCSCDGST